MASIVLTPGNGSELAVPVNMPSKYSNPRNTLQFALALVNAMDEVTAPDSTPLTVVYTYDDVAFTLTVSGIS